jgi:hypothetical protein
MSPKEKEDWSKVATKPWRMPVKFFNVAVITPGGFTESPSMTPKAAAKRSPEEFLRFADEVAAAAAMIQAEQAQAKLDLGSDGPGVFSTTDGGDS